MSTPIITRLDSVPMRPWLIRVRSTTMVLDNEMSPPSHSADRQSQPSQVPSPKP